MAGAHSGAPSPTGAPIRLVMLLCGTLLALATMAAWLWGASHEIDTSPLFAFIVPIVGALFLADRIADAGDAARQAAHQTNGGLGPRIEAAVTAAMAQRDQARTYQAGLEHPAVAPLAAPESAPVGVAQERLPADGSG